MDDDFKSLAIDGFDSKLKPFITEISSAALGASVLSCSDDFFASKDNLIKPNPAVSLKGQFGPNGALYDGWESRRHNPSFDRAIIVLAPQKSHLQYIDIDTSHFSGNEAPSSSVLALRAEEIPSDEVKLNPNDSRWEEILPVVELGPDSRHVFELGAKAKEGIWSAVMVRMIPDGGMARFRAYGHPLPPTPLTTLPPSETPPINLLDPLLSARIVACSDAKFSPPGNLLRSARGVDMSDGWETRRSQAGRGKYGPGGAMEGKERKEWVVAKLAGTGVVRWVEVDTAFHPGNYPVACAIEAILSNEDVPPEEAQWTTIVEKKPLGPHRQHWLDIERSIPPDQVFSHVRLSIYPDGGIKRLRVYGHPFSPSTTQSLITDVPTLPALPLTVEAFKPYGHVIQGYSLPSSAPKGIDVTVVNQGTASKFHRLGQVKETYAQGLLKRGGLYIACTRSEKRLDVKDGAEVPLMMLERHAHTSQCFIPMGKGTLPGTTPLNSGGAYLSVVALNGKDDRPDMSTLRAFLGTAAQGVSYTQGVWHHNLLTLDGPLDYALIEAQIGDVGHILDLEKVLPEKPMAHIQVPPYTAFSPFPDMPTEPDAPSALNKLMDMLPSLPQAPSTSSAIVPVPITPELFAPFGQLILPYPDEASRTPGMDIQPSPDGKTVKYARLADIVHTYPEGSGAFTGTSVFRATPKVGLERGREFDVRFMERHPYTSQAFIPMGKAELKGMGEEALPAGGEMLVVVAKNGSDDRPDPSTLKAFIMPSSFGLSYFPGTWHHPSLVLDATLDLACVETQISTGVAEPDARDCELLEWPTGEAFGRVSVPALQ